MSIKERLFGPRWQHKDVSIRLQAVSHDNDPRLFEQLSTIAHQDPDTKVRLAALRRLDHQSQWLKTSLNDSDQKLRNIANDWLVKNVIEHPADDHLDERLKWLETLNQPETIRKIAQSAKDSALRAAALQRIQSQGFLGDCYVNESDDAVADELLKRVEQSSTLQRISDKLRKKNKGRYQKVLQRLAEMESGTASNASNQARNELAGQLVEKLEQLACGGASDNRAEQLKQIQQQWHRLPEPDAGLIRRYTGALHILELAMSDRPRHEPESVADAQETARKPNPELVALADRLHRLITQEPDTQGQEIELAIQTTQADFDHAWNQTDASAADQVVKQRFTALLDEYKSRQSKAERSYKQTKPSRTAQTDPGPELITRLDPALSALNKAVEAGDVATAEKKLATARSLFDRLPEKYRDRELSGKLSRMNGRVRELRNWQRWSNNELRERLIERVGQIDVETMHPDAVTSRLKELRERWKALDQQEASANGKPRYAAPQGQWRRFQKLANDVYEATRPYLEKRSAVQQQALEELREFMNEAEPLAQNASTDRSTLIRYQRAARQAIRHLNSLPPKQRGKMAARLRELMDRISKLLDAQFDRSEQEKRRLIAEARKLEHEKDRDMAIEQAKSLQAQWKKIPPASRKVDEQLWREFRQPIDPLFEGLKKEREQKLEQDRERIHAMKALCMEVEKLAAAADDELDAVAGPIAGLEEQWSSQSAPAQLNKRFNLAITKYQQRLQKRIELKQQQKIEQLHDLTKALQNCWNQRAAGQGVPGQPEFEFSDHEATATKLLGRLAEFSDPASDHSSLATRVQGLTDRARQVTIEMEALSGLETPVADRKQRMDYQVQRLSERLGQGQTRPDLSTEHDQLRQRWLESFPHIPQQHQELKKRFEAGDKILKNMTSK